jgi:hypothetical protein
MHKNWQVVYITKYYTEAEIVRGKLEQNEIPAQIVNRQDTMYNIALGEIEIHVPVHLTELATGLLSKSLEN